MRALRWDGTRLALARDAPDPRPGAGEALVRVHLAGICRTDLEITRGYLGFRGTPGHEWVGHVLAADDPALVGRRVVGEINLGCGVCRSCRAGLGRHCPKRTVLGILKHPGVANVLAVFFYPTLRGSYCSMSGDLPRGRTEIDARLENVTEPQSFGSEYLTYVLWAVSPEGRPHNIGDPAPGAAVLCHTL